MDIAATRFRIAKSISGLSAVVYTLWLSAQLGQRATFGLPGALDIETLIDL